MRHRVSFVQFVVCVLLVLPSCASGGPRVVQVTIRDVDSALTVGETLLLAADVTVVGDAATTVLWRVDGAAVTVEDGLVTAVALGTATVTATSTFDASRTDSVAVHVVPFGTHVWTQQFGGESFDFAWAVAIDGADDLLVVGGTASAIDGQVPAGEDDAFVRKLDRQGQHLWTHQFGTSTQELAYGVAIDAGDHVLVAGYTMGALAGQAHLGGGDAFVRKLGPDGEPHWSHQFGTPANDTATCVAVDSAGHLFVAGYTAGALPGQASQGEHDAFVQRLDPDGLPAWTRQFGTSGRDYAEAVAIDTTGNVVVVGATDGALAAGGHQGDFDVFVRKFDPAGQALWTRQFGSAETDYGVGVAIDPMGNVFVAGFTRAALADQTHAGGTDAFLMKLDPGGVPVWTRQFGSAENDFAYGVAVDARGYVVVVGETHGRVDGLHAGDADAFVRRTHR